VTVGKNVADMVDVATSEGFLIYDFWHCFFLCLYFQILISFIEC